MGRIRSLNKDTEIVRYIQVKGTHHRHALEKRSDLEGSVFYIGCLNAVYICSLDHVGLPFYKYKDMYLSFNIKNPVTETVWKK